MPWSKEEQRFGSDSLGPLGLVGRLAKVKNEVGIRRPRANDQGVILPRGGRGCKKKTGGFGKLARYSVGLCGWAERWIGASVPLRLGQVVPRQRRQIKGDRP